VDTRALAHGKRQPLRARQAFAEDASRIRENPDIAARLRSFAYNPLRAGPRENIKNARWRAGLDINHLFKIARQC
jgi:hypothetical protein